jgi:hypothetical protein
MTDTATQLTDKFRKDVERVSQDKVQGEIVRRLRAQFAAAPAIRARRGVVLLSPIDESMMPVMPSAAAKKILRTVGAKKKRK